MYLPQPVLRETTAPSRARFFQSFRFAWQGIVYVVRTQRNARVHLSIGVLVLALAVLLRVSRLEYAVLIGCSMVVIAAEMVNTVAESIVDLVTDRYHPLAKVAKDAAAGAVLVTAIGSAVIGVLLLGPPLWQALVR
jgi:diacylglycerol kinase